jgi:L-fuculose-phosphate aldolase
VSHDPSDSSPQEAVSVAGRVLAANGHDDYVWGHVSLRDGRNRGVWMKASGLGFEEVDADAVILVGWDGDVIVGAGRRHIEWPIHCAVMRARSDVNSVVHTHPPHSIALGASGQPLRPVSHAGSMFAPPDVPRFDRTSNLIVTPALGADVAQMLGSAPALLLVNHGIVAVGATIADAVVRAVLLEQACHHQLLATALGGVTHWTADDEALEKREVVWHESQRQAMWDYLVRRLRST